jgi:hypothetical protein
MGDAVQPRRATESGARKGADAHILVADQSGRGASTITVAGVVEIKSYAQTPMRIKRQLDRHLDRARYGLYVNGREYRADRVQIGVGHLPPIRIGSVPATWKLSRSFRFENVGDKRLLHVERRSPPAADDTITQVGDGEWRITLRWSQEALAEAAYEMTFWYMEQVGEVIYSDSVPRDWSEMSPAEAGRNAAKMMLYYAILRLGNSQAAQRAIALYNVYAFHYALGMNYLNAAGQREMLWPQDLDEISLKAATASGCRIR